MTISAMKVISMLVSFMSEDKRIKQFVYQDEFENIQVMLSLELPEMAFDVIDEAYTRYINRLEADSDLAESKLTAYLTQLRLELSEVRRALAELRLNERDIPS